IGRRRVERVAIDAHLVGHLDELVVRQLVVAQALLAERTLQDFGDLFLAVRSPRGRVRHGEPFWPRFGPSPRRPPSRAPADGEGTQFSRQVAHLYAFTPSSSPACHTALRHFRANG